MIHLDPTSRTPIYQQIEEQIAELIVMGVFPPESLSLIHIYKTATGERCRARRYTAPAGWRQIPSSTGSR